MSSQNLAEEVLPRGNKTCDLEKHNHKCLQDYQFN